MINDWQYRKSTQKEGKHISSQYIVKQQRITRARRHKRTLTTTTATAVATESF